jgi:hypothetical protein
MCGTRVFEVLAVVVDKADVLPTFGSETPRHLAKKSCAVALVAELEKGYGLLAVG